MQASSHGKDKAQAKARCRALMWGQSLNDDKTNGEKKGRGAEGPVP